MDTHGDPEAEYELQEALACRPDLAVHLQIHARRSDEFGGLIREPAFRFVTAPSVSDNIQPPVDGLGGQPATGKHSVRVLHDGNSGIIRLAPGN